MNIHSEDNIPLEIEGIDVVQNEPIAIDCLEKKETIARFEFGDSMLPFLKSGQFCKLVPLAEDETVEVGDIVTSVINNSLNTHMVGMKKEINGETWYLIVTSNWQLIGWTDKILAKAYGMDHIVDNKHYPSAKSVLSDIVSISMADNLVYPNIYTISNTDFVINTNTRN